MTSKPVIDLKHLTSLTKIEDLMVAFLSGRKKSTIEGYEIDIKAFTAFIQKCFRGASIGAFFKLAGGEANHLVLKFKNELYDGGFAPASINRKLATIRSLTKLARTLGFVNWAIEIENVKVVKYRDTSGPPLVVYKRMLDAARASSSAKAARDRALLRLLFDLALRASEAVSLDLNDFEAETSMLAILGKGQTQKTFLNIPQTSKDALLDWIVIRGVDPGPLFINFDRTSSHRRARLTRYGLYQIVRELGRKAGVKTRPHGLRHLSITEAVRVAQNNGYGIEEVMDHSRHRSVATLMIYRDKISDVQGKISTLVSRTISESDDL